MVDTLHMGFQLSGWKSVIDKHSRVLVANLEQTHPKPSEGEGMRNRKRYIERV